jgi:hypothetical protein
VPHPNPQSGQILPVAAVTELNYGDYVSAGKPGASTNDFTDGSTGVAVNLNYPPTRGSFALEDNFAEAIRFPSRMLTDSPICRQ